jgi:hypothetical protein
MRKNTYELVLSRPIPRSTNTYRFTRQSLKNMPLREMYTMNTFARLSAMTACIKDGKFEEAGIYRLKTWFDKKSFRPMYSIRRIG